MHLSRIHIDTHVFVLTAGQDVGALKESIVALIESGAGFVEFDTVGRGTVSVLVTARLPVLFETFEHVEGGLRYDPADLAAGPDFDIDFPERFGA